MHYASWSLKLLVCGCCRLPTSNWDHFFIYFVVFVWKHSRWTRVSRRLRPQILVVGIASLRRWTRVLRWLRPQILVDSIPSISMALAGLLVLFHPPGAPNELFVLIHLLLVRLFAHRRCRWRLHTPIVLTLTVWLNAVRLVINVPIVLVWRLSSIWSLKLWIMPFLNWVWSLL